jgi:hypothetical protein
MLSTPRDQRISLGSLSGGGACQIRDCGGEYLGLESFTFCRYFSLHDQNDLDNLLYSPRLRSTILLALSFIDKLV